MKGFYYVYILVSEADGRLHYSGLTRDLNTRLAEHNRGKCPHTSKHRPWKIETAIAFRSEAKARRFERYLKTGSGREFCAPPLVTVFGAVFSAKGAASTASLGQRPRFMAAKEHQR
jgi:predicted GIY-YIG superfamily endonuclease